MKITREKYTVAINEKGGITSLISGGKEFIKKALPLMQFRLRDGGKTELFTSDDADKVCIKQDGDSVCIKYAYNALRIAFDVSLTFNKRIEATLLCKNQSGRYVEWVDLLQIAVPNDLVRTGGSGRLVLDINEGLLIEDLAAKENYRHYAYREMEYPSLGLYYMFPAVVQSQFMAYYDDSAGIYFAAEDKDRGIKGLDFFPLDGAIKLQIRLYPTQSESDKSFDLPYSLVVDFFNGDWHDAAQLYRDWFESNLPCDLTAVEENSDLPEWYCDSPVIVTYPVQGVHDRDEAIPNRLFPYHNVFPYIDEISEHTKSRIMTLLMHWEGTAPWAPPFVWPPLGGEELMRDFCSKLHQRGHLLGVYCSGAGYTVNSNINGYTMQKEYDEKGLARYMCASPEGKIESKICQAQRTSYDMCISQDFTKNLLCDEAEKMASCGLDYIQLLDQNHGGSPYFCYSDKHGHPAVPGKWMVGHMTELLKRIKSTVGKNVLLGCESAAAEAYIPYLHLSDNRFNLNYMVGRPIPVYGYIYHKYLHNFSGNSVSSLKFIDIHRSPDCHMMRVAYSFLAGDLMTLVINQDGDIVWSWGERDFSYLPERAPVLDFIKTATAYRRGVGKKYLVFGQMIKPCEVKCDTVPMYKPDSDYVTEYPAVLTTAWQASDGKRAQFFASYRNKAEAFTLDLRNTNGADVIDENGNVVGNLMPEICTLKLPAHSVIMIEFI